MTDPLFTPCACCGAPYHPATGGLHWVEFTKRWVPWCGRCERDFVKWFVAHQKGRFKRVKNAMTGGKTKVLHFYDYAFPPVDNAPEDW
jgi:hypothetical protein